MQQHKVGNILDEVTEGFIVQQVNAQGKMNSGMAKAIREKWPDVWERYNRLCFSQHVPLGTVLYVPVTETICVANLFGQEFYGRDGLRYTSYDALDIGFNDIANSLSTYGMKEVHYPLIGCGLGGGEWSIVSSIIKHRLDTIPHTLWTLPE